MYYFFSAFLLKSFIYFHYTEWSVDSTKNQQCSLTAAFKAGPNPMCVWVPACFNHTEFLNRYNSNRKKTAAADTELYRNINGHKSFSIVSSTSALHLFITRFTAQREKRHNPIFLGTPGLFAFGIPQNMILAKWNLTAELICFCHFMLHCYVNLRRSLRGEKKCASLRLGTK